jgi:TonB family protein
MFRVAPDRLARLEDPEMTTESDLQPAREQVQSHIQKTVAVSALRKIRGLVDEYEEEERHARRMTPIGIALLCLAVVAVLLSLFVFRIAPTERAAVPPAPVENAARPLRVERGAHTEDPAVTRYGLIWASRIEKSGAKAIPPVIRDKALYGSVILTTHIRTEDGTVERVEVTRSSGHPQLDDAAQQIVMRALPFPPLSDELKKKGGTIRITREFHFTQD